MYKGKYKKDFWERVPEENRKLRHKTLQNFIGDANYVACNKDNRIGIHLLRPVYPLLDEDIFKKAIKARRTRHEILVAAKTWRR